MNRPASSRPSAIVCHWAAGLIGAPGKRHGPAGKMQVGGFPGDRHFAGVDTGANLRGLELNGRRGESTSTQHWGGSPGAGGRSPSPEAERATRHNPKVPSPPRSTSIGETRSSSPPRRIQVRPPSCVIQSSTVAGPLGPASSTAYWSLNFGLATRSVSPGLPPAGAALLLLHRRPGRPTHHRRLRSHRRRRPKTGRRLAGKARARFRRPAPAALESPSGFVSGVLGPRLASARGVRVQTAVLPRRAAMLIRETMAGFPSRV